MNWLSHSKKVCTGLSFWMTIINVNNFLKSILFTLWSKNLNKYSAVEKKLSNFSIKVWRKVTLWKSLASNNKSHVLLIYVYSQSKTKLLSQHAWPRQEDHWSGWGSNPLPCCFHWLKTRACHEGVRLQKILLVPWQQRQLYRVFAWKQWWHKSCCHVWTWGKTFGLKMFAQGGLFME